MSIIPVGSQQTGDASPEQLPYLKCTPAYACLMGPDAREKALLHGPRKDQKPFIPDISDA
ncbi:unnamed protein product [Clonostachys chloroleuca]|uniref:Uncharacterized protein n=1 Tax=Clonostachys chloroleuca TaxID=1926264 RepID=A0AA35LWX5_9HYPO|nr:unnamed protein product [Clonostachys chloroleuca]